MSNPFAAKPAAAEAPATEAASVFEQPTVDPEIAEVEAEAAAEENYGKFPGAEPEPKPKGKPTDQATVPTKRLAQVVRQRNDLRETLAEKEARLAAAEAEAAVLRELQATVSKHYRENPGMLDFDARFMSQFETMAKTDATIAAVAQRIKAAMSGEEAPVTTTPEKKEVAPVAAPAADPALDKIIARDVNRTVAEVLGEHGVKPHFIKAVATDLLQTLPAAELADLTPEDVVEIAKTFVEANEIPMTEFLTPKKGGAKPATTSGRSTPASAPTAEADAAEERAKPKSVEEWEANRNKRFKALTRELGFGS